MIRPRTPILAALFALTIAGPTPAANPRKAGNPQAAAIHQQQAAMRQQQAAMRQRQSLGTSSVPGAPPIASNRARASTAGAGAVHPSGYRGGNTSTGQHQNGQQLTSALHSTMARLNQADHDYQGHRARAVHELGQAIHTLQPQSNTNANGLGKSGLGGSGGNNANRAGTGTGQGQKMPQAQSDQHLQAARETLMTIQRRMSSAGTATGGNAAHHQKLTGHVQRALQEVNTALALK